MPSSHSRTAALLNGFELTSDRNRYQGVRYGLADPRPCSTALGSYGMGEGRSKGNA